LTEIVEHIFHLLDLLSICFW